MLAAAERFALSASSARLAAALAAVLLTFCLNALANAPVEQVLRAGECGLWDCIRPLRPETRQAGYTAAEFRDFLVLTGHVHGRALVALLTDVPLSVAIAIALLIAAGLASRGLPISERSRRLLFILPLAFASADLIEDVLLALAYGHMADVSIIVPWASALKFGLLVASGLLSALLGFASWMLAPSE